MDSRQHSNKRKRQEPHSNTALSSGATARKLQNSTAVPTSNWEALRANMAAKSTADPLVASLKYQHPPSSALSWADISAGAIIARPTPKGAPKSAKPHSGSVVSTAAASTHVTVAVTADAGSLEATAESVVLRKRALLGPPDAPQAITAGSEESRFVALDCEMVGVGKDGKRSVLAEVVLVDWHGTVIYHTHVLPKEPVTDYRTAVSGVLPEHLKPGRARRFEDVARDVAELTNNKLLVGHGLSNDLGCLLLKHSWRQVRDTALYRPFCYRNREGKWRPQRLKQLVLKHLGIVIQEGEHDPAEDARAALALYKRFRREWESSLASGGPPGTGSASKSHASENVSKPRASFNRHERKHDRGERGRHRVG
jgi:RNA exonuclease 4